MKKIILFFVLLTTSSILLADTDYGLIVKNGTRIASAMLSERPIWSIDGVAISKQEEYRAILDVTVTINNGICGAEELHSKIKYDDQKNNESDKIVYLNLSVAATGSSLNFSKGCYTSSSGPVQVVLEIPVEINSTNSEELIEYIFIAGKSSFSIIGQYGKEWKLGRLKQK